MCKDVAEAFPAAREIWNRADAALGTSLSALAFDGPADELTQTHNAQPALLTHGAAIWAVVKEKVAPHVRAAAGHSLGELTAYHTAGALPLEDAVKLVRKRGELMYETGTSRPGAMAAILGELQRPIEEICQEASAAGEVVPANYNALEQVVVSGEIAGVEKAMELAKAAGAKRAVRLGVSGAFHSPLMKPAADGLKTALDAAAFTQAELAPCIPTSPRSPFASLPTRARFSSRSSPVRCDGWRSFTRWPPRIPTGCLSRWDPATFSPVSSNVSRRGIRPWRAAPSPM